jgi:peptidoglycan/LPS O-acetylase OafA/YrhL
VSDMKNGHPERLYDIDALRGIAALCVVIFHLKVMTAHPGGLIGLNTVLGRWGNAYLWTAVDLFFVISGFIFAHVYLRDGRLNPHTTVTGYAVARVARIYPLHLATLFIVAGIVWAGAPLAPSFDQTVVNYEIYHFVLNLLMLQASGLERGFSFNSPAWSLTSEFVCYGLFFVFARAGGRWLIIGALIAISAGIIADIHPELLPIPSRVARGLVGFFVGLFLHHYRTQLQNIPLPALIMLAMGGIVLTPYIERNGVNAGIVMAFAVWPWFILLCLHPVSSWFLQTRPMQFIGDLSYSTYLLHIPLALIFLTANGGRYFGLGDFRWIAPLYFATLLVLAWLSFSRFEEPMRRKIRMIGKANAAT